MNYRNILILAALLLGTATTGCELIKKHQMMLADNPIPKTKDSIARGKKIFFQNCIPCHGESGQGDGPIAKSLTDKPANLTKLDKSPGVIAMRIYYGSGAMPPWRHQLSKDMIWDVVNYIEDIAEE